MSNYSSSSSDDDSLYESLQGTIVGLLGTAFCYFSGAYFSISADSCSEESSLFDSGFRFEEMKSMGLGYRVLEWIAEWLVEKSGRDVAGFVYCGPAIISSIISSAFGTSENTIDVSSDDDPIIAVFFRGDAVPYNRVEKKAEMIYNGVKRTNKQTESFPSIIATKKETYEAFLPVYGKSVNSLVDNLHVLEGALSNDTEYQS